ncbi:MAG: FMN-binding negative transcriptional regulator [Planctomycetota bacterium]
MYIPSAFNETDRNTLFDFVELHSFGVLVTQHDGAPFATHLPFLAERDVGEHGQLVSHMARANPHWMQANGHKVLAIFSGPHAYISPAWYEVPNAVPTWNYTAVHVSGTFEIVDNPDDVMELLARTVKQYEAPRATPWVFDASNEFYKKLAQQIVAFRIRITSIEGKWKLNQNRPAEQQERVARALELSADPTDNAVAALMTNGLKARSTYLAP